MGPVCERVHPVGRSAVCSVSGVLTTAESQAHVNLYAGGTLASSSHPATEPRSGRTKGEGFCCRWRLRGTKGAVAPRHDAPVPSRFIVSRQRAIPDVTVADAVTMILQLDRSVR